MNNHDHTTGAELQTLREAAGLTREALAELAHVEARTVKHWETRKGAAVPADVAAIVNDAARWVGTAARLALQQIATSDHKPAEVVLIRYREAEHMHPADRARGLRPDIHGAMLARLVLDLAADGIRPRVVWFDPGAYLAWQLQNLPEAGGPLNDTPEARAAWASWTINADAIPHPGDQPPAGHTPGR